MAWAERIERLPFRDRIVLHLSEGLDAGRLDAMATIGELPRDTHIYVCGPAAYMSHLVDASKTAAVEPEQIHLEHFGAEIDINGDPFTVVAARSRKRVQVGPTETVLAALQGAGILVETSCQNGVCGSCITTVLDGKPDHRDMVLTQEEKAENNRMTVCCSRSRSAVLVLDL